MFDKLFSRNRPEATSPTEDDELEVSFAALLVEAARADEDYADHEKAIIDRTLAARFSLSAADASRLREKAETAQSAALDIQQFTRHAKTMSADEKIAFLEGLWEIILSDGVRDSYEDTLVRRICGLIYIEDRLSGMARARVEERLRSS